MPELYKVTALPDGVKEKIVTPKGEIDQQKSPTNASSKKDAGDPVVNEKAPTNLQKKLDRLNVKIQFGGKGEKIVCKLEQAEKAEKTKNSLQKVLAEDERPTLAKPKVTLTIKVPDSIMSRDTEDIAVAISIDIGKAMNELRLQAKDKIMMQQIQFKKDQETYRIELGKLRKTEEEMLAKAKVKAREDAIVNLVTGGLSTLFTLASNVVTVASLTLSLVSSGIATGGLSLIVGIPTYAVGIAGVSASTVGTLGSFSCDIAAAYIEFNETDEKKKEQMLKDVATAKLVFTIITVVGTIVTVAAELVGIVTMPGVGSVTGTAAGAAKGAVGAAKLAKDAISIAAILAKIGAAGVTVVKSGYQIKQGIDKIELAKQREAVELRYAEQEAKMLDLKKDTEEFNKILDQLRDWTNYMQEISQWIADTNRDKSRTEADIARNF